MQVENTTPMYSRGPLTVSALAGVCDVKVVSDHGIAIGGRWCDELHWLTLRGDSCPAEEFANYNPRPVRASHSRNSRQRWAIFSGAAPTDRFMLNRCGYAEAMRLFFLAASRLS